MKTAAYTALLATLAATPVLSQAQTQTVPQISPGNVFHYRLDIRTASEGTALGVVENPQGASRVEIRLSASLRLEALAVAPSDSATPRPDMRATFEQVSVALGGDVYDPALEDLAKRYRRLDGATFLFSAHDAHHQSAARRPPPLDSRLAAMAQGWVRLLVLGYDAPLLRPATWSDERSSRRRRCAAPSASHYTYLRDEPCGPGDRAAVHAQSLAEEPCAVLLLHTTIAQARAASDATPDAFREQSLRTAGRWEGSGETLAYIAQRTGWLVSITEVQVEQMDYTVSRAGGEEILRRRGRIETQTNLLLQSVETRK